MATTITNASAIAALVDFAIANGCDNQEAIEKAQLHVAQLSKPAKKAEGPTKNQLMNQNLIARVVGHMQATGATMTVKDVATWLSENCGETVGLCSTQKATALLTQAVKAGYLSRVTDGKRIAFVAVA